MKQKKVVSNNLYSDIKIILEQARERSYRTINFLMVEAYWNIGRLIVEEEQKGKRRADYGSFLIKELSKKLTKDFGKGFDERNLWYMVKFYNAFPIVNALRSESKNSISQKLNAPRGESSDSIHLAERDKSRAKENENAVSSELQLSATAIDEAVHHTSVDLKNYLRPELSWTHYRLLLKLEKEKARLFYMNEAANSSWSTRELERQINSLLFERLTLSKDKKAVIRMAKKGQAIGSPEDLVKDPYVLEFLGLEKMEKYYEEDLEKALINHLQKFLLELGKGFSFVARQKRITLDGDHYYIDLVFYNRLTRSHILFDLKVGKLTHLDIGQMQMYVNYYNRTQKLKDENDTIGILLCAEKNNAVIKYTLPEKQKQIFISKYIPYLPTEDELRNEIMKEKEQFDMEKKLLRSKNE
ncbi:MAG: PDDEXK nuclease domain-containing protein [Flammeovirgaceae bacterium]